MWERVREFLEPRFASSWGVRSLRPKFVRRYAADIGSMVETFRREDDAWLGQYLIGAQFIRILCLGVGGFPKDAWQRTYDLHTFDEAGQYVDIESYLEKTRRLKVRRSDSPGVIGTSIMLGSFRAQHAEELRPLAISERFRNRLSGLSLRCLLYLLNWCPNLV